MPVTRGFKGRKRAEEALKERIPPGQHLTTDFPVLSAGPTPRTTLNDWTFAIHHRGSLVATWRWADFEALPQSDVVADIHCVTKWSKLDTRWRGVAFDDLLEAAALETSPTMHVMAHCDSGYSTNVPVADLTGGKAMIATHFEGLPLSPAHGGPARLLVPHLYFWKSAKWVRRLAFIDRDEPGFWESLGYHNCGDPSREQRYAGDE